MLFSFFSSFEELHKLNGVFFYLFLWSLESYITWPNGQNTSISGLTQIICYTIWKVGGVAGGGTNVYLTHCKTPLQPGSSGHPNP